MLLRPCPEPGESPVMPMPSSSMRMCKAMKRFDGAGDPEWTDVELESLEQRKQAFNNSWNKKCQDMKKMRKCINNTSKLLKSRLRLSLKNYLLKLINYQKKL